MRPNQINYIPQAMNWWNNNTRTSQERWASEYSDPNPLHRRSLGQKVTRALGGFYNYGRPKDRPHYSDTIENIWDSGLLRFASREPERNNLLLDHYLLQRSMSLKPQPNFQNNRPGW